MNELSKALFEAHVAHELSESRPDAFHAAVDRMTALAFEWLGNVRLDELLTRELVLGVIERYVIDLRISGGITELAGQMSQLVFASDVRERTRVDELLPYESYREYADKIESLGDAHDEVIRLIGETRAFRSLLARGLTMAVMQTFFAPTAERKVFLRGVLSELRRDLGKALGQQLEQRLSQYIEQHGDRIVQAVTASARDVLPMETLRSIADELWNTIGATRLSELFSLLTVADFEDFLVLNYETWNKFRKTPFFHTTCTQVVDAIFLKYGAESVQLLLDDMGVSEAMIANEVRTLLTPALVHAERTGFRERQIRARLEPFYRSDAVALLLAQTSHEP